MADLKTVLRIIAKDETKGAINKTKQELLGVKNTLGSIKNEVLALTGISFSLAGLSQVVALADAYALTTSRLKLLSGETENFLDIQNQVFDIAQDTFTSYEQTAGIYGNLAASTREIGLESEELLTITRALTQSYKISGSTQQEAAASTIQLVQALASGQIRGQEFNSVAEQGRRILFALKDATGLTAGELREFANAGQLTTEFFVNAFLPQAEKINEEFETIPITVGRSLTQVQNAFQRYVGELNEDLGITADIAGVFSDLAENFNEFAESIITVGAGVIAFLSGRFIGVQAIALNARLKNIAATQQELRAQTLLQIAEVRTLRTKLSVARAEETQARVALFNARQQQASIVLRDRLEKKLTATITARIALEAKLATATTAVGVAAARSAVALRAWNGLLTFSGGPIGLAVVGIAGLVYAMEKFGKDTETAEEAIESWRDSVQGAKRDAEDAAKAIGEISTELDDILTTSTRLEFADEIAALAAGENALKTIAQEIEGVRKGLNVPLGGIFLEGQDKRLEELRKKYEETAKQVEKFREQLRKQVLDEKEVQQELAQREGQVSGVPFTLRNALKDQKDANSALEAIEKRRRSLIDALNDLSTELSGEAFDVERQTDAFNILSLNRLRQAAADNIRDADPEEAVRNLEQAKAIIDRLKDSGSVSSGFLKTQVGLIQKLVDQAGDIEVEDPKIAEKLKKQAAPILKVTQDIADGMQGIIDQVGFDNLLKSVQDISPLLAAGLQEVSKIDFTLDPDEASARAAGRADALAYQEARKQFLEQNPAEQRVSQDKKASMDELDKTLKEEQKKISDEPLEEVIKLRAEPDLESTEAAVNASLLTQQQITQEFLKQNPQFQPVDIDQEATNANYLQWQSGQQELANNNPVIQPFILQALPANIPGVDTNQAPELAAGGYVSGPGTTTSDSILSWLSNGEFVIRAAAVQHYGADFFRRLNAMVMPRFASGGEVRVPSVTAPQVSGAPIIFNINGQEIEATVSGGGVASLRTALRRENMKRGARA